MSLLMALLLVGSSFAKTVQSPEPLKVEGGLLQGTVEDGLTIYRGIPYAAPPVGDLRWRAPQHVRIRSCPDCASATMMEDWRS